MKKCFICGRVVSRFLVLPDCEVCLRCVQNEDKDLLVFLAFPMDLEELSNGK